MPRNTTLKRIKKSEFYNACPDDLTESEWLFLAQHAHLHQRDRYFDIDAFEGSLVRNLARYGYCWVMPNKRRSRHTMMPTDKALALLPSMNGVQCGALC